MDTRELTVYRGSGWNYAPVPKIILQGQWLSSLGFSIGDKVTITRQQGKVVIEQIADGQAGQEIPETARQTGKRQGKGHTYGRY